MTNFITAEELAAALPHVLEAPKTQGRVHMLCTRPGYNKRVFPERIAMSRSGGIEGDFEMNKPWLKLEDGNPDPRIQVSILPLRVLDLVWRDREKVAHPGDNIIADFDVTETNLPTRSLIRIGTAVVRLSVSGTTAASNGRPAMVLRPIPGFARPSTKSFACAASHVPSSGMARSQSAT